MSNKADDLGVDLSIKRILVAHNVPTSRTGGMSRIMGFIHDRVAQHGFEIREFNAEDTPPYAKGKWGRFGFGWAVYRHIRDEHLAGRSYDVVNLHEPNTGIVSLLRRFCGNPIVVATSHGVEQRAWELALDERTLGRSGPSLKTRLIYPATQLVQSNYGLRNADHIFCLNEEDKTFIVDRFNRNVSDITRICPAADISFSKAAMTRNYSRCRRLLFAGVWRKNKGIEDIIPAFKLLHEQFPKLVLDIFGGGFPPEYILNQFPSELRSSVVIKQSRTESETIQVFADADIFVLPSLFEGTPLVLMEAMMSGLPIVTTATCGMKDVVRAEQNGILVPIRSPIGIANAISRLVADEPLRASLGQAAFEDAKSKYTWDLVSETVISSYEELFMKKRLKVK